MVLHRSLQGSSEVLVRFASLKDAVSFLRDSTNGDYPTKDALLRAFVEAYHAESRPHWSAQLLLGALQPGLNRLFHQHAGRWSGLEDAELWGLIIASFLEVVSSYHLSRRPHRIAKNLLMDTSASHSAGFMCITAVQPRRDPAVPQTIVPLRSRKPCRTVYLALVEQRVGKVDRWTTSDQKQRWLAATLLEIEPRLCRLRGYRALLQLRGALKRKSCRVRR